MCRLAALLLVVCPALRLSAACPASLSVGFQVVSFGSVQTAVWYPTQSAEAPYTYSMKTTGWVALNAAPATCGSFPMVVFSHGYSGCGTQSVFITEQLARNGYVVAAPNHADAGCSVSGSGMKIPPPPQVSFLDPGSWTDQTYIDRRNDIETVIDDVLTSSVFGPVVDGTKIAGMGHSLGGYTILAMAGAWPSWKDARIKSVVALSPYAQPFESQKTLGGIGVPVMYQGGTLDFGITPFVAAPGGAYDSTPSPKFFAELKKAGHLAWTNLTCFSAGSVANCLGASANAALIDKYGFAFFGQFMLGEAEPVLIGVGAGLADYRHSAR
jgi:predicted dienelactone hydrolase